MYELDATVTELDATVTELDATVTVLCLKTKYYAVSSIVRCANMPQCANMPHLPLYIGTYELYPKRSCLLLKVWL